MIYTQMVNANLGKVGEGMMKMAEAMDIAGLDMNPGEKLACIVGLFGAVVSEGSPVHGREYSVNDFIQVFINMREEAKRTKRPEYGAAVKYVQREMLV